MDDVRRTIEAVARESYGRLLAYLSARLRDVAAAEDALGDAFVKALTTWPRDGLPQAPEAWLLTAARHRLLDRARRDQRLQTASARALELLTAKAEAAPRAVPRRAPEADVRLRPPGHRPGGAHAAHAANRAGAGRGGHRPRLSRFPGGHGAAARARQGQDPRRRHRLRGAGRVGAAPAS